MEDTELQLERGILTNAQTFSAVFNNIFLKYDRPFDEEDGGLEINFRTPTEFEKDLSSFLNKEDDLPYDYDSLVQEGILEQDEEDVIITGEDVLDPELTARLHEKVQQIKREINWSEDGTAPEGANHIPTSEWEDIDSGSDTMESDYEDESICMPSSPSAQRHNKATDSTLSSLADHVEGNTKHGASSTSGPSVSTVEHRSERNRPHLSGLRWLHPVLNITPVPMPKPTECYARVQSCSPPYFSPGPPHCYCLSHRDTSLSMDTCSCPSCQRALPSSLSCGCASWAVHTQQSTNSCTCHNCNSYSSHNNCIDCCSVSDHVCDDGACLCGGCSHGQFVPYHQPAYCEGSCQDTSVCTYHGAEIVRSSTHATGSCEQATRSGKRRLDDYQDGNPKTKRHCTSL